MSDKLTDNAWCQAIRKLLEDKIMLKVILIVSEQ